MAQTIAISNHKGGVGKTTTAINIGAGLARKGNKVLLVDLDAQANLTGSLHVEDTTANVYELLKGTAQAQPVAVTDNLHVIPAVLDLATAEMELTTAMGREYLLKEVLEPLQDAYDYIIIDTAPSLGLLAINAFTAANSVIIPMQAEFLALAGIVRLTEVITNVQKRINPTLEIGGVIITQYDNRKVLNRQVVETISNQFGGVVFSTRVRNNVALAEAPAAGLDIFRYEPKSTGAADYGDIVEELLYKTTINEE